MKFEGDEVDGGNDILMRQFRGDISIPLTLDEEVTLTVTGMVTSVAHEVNKKNGTMTRTHIVHVNEVEAHEK
jgi:hypothetical protein